MNYAIIAAGGKQHRVRVGQRCRFESMTGELGDSVEFDQVLLIGGDKIHMGLPFIDKAKVVAKIVKHGRGEKITIIKMRRRKGYRRKQGHRQNFTEVEITSIVA